MKTPARTKTSGEGFTKDQAIAAEAWSRIAEGLSRSDSPEDRALADHVNRFLSGTFAVDAKRKLEAGREPGQNTRPVRQMMTVVTRSADDPDVPR